METSDPRPVRRGSSFSHFFLLPSSSLFSLPLYLLLSLPPSVSLSLFLSSSLFLLLSFCFALSQTKHGLNITDYIPPNPAMIVIPTGTPLHPVHMPETKCYFQLHSPHPQCLINEVLPILLKISSICPSFLFPTNTTKLEEDSFIRHITQLSVMNLLNYTSIKYRRLFTWLSILVTV